MKVKLDHLALGTLALGLERNLSSQALREGLGNDYSTHACMHETSILLLALLTISYILALTDLAVFHCVFSPCALPCYRCALAHIHSYSSVVVVASSLGDTVICLSSEWLVTSVCSAQTSFVTQS